MPNRSKKGCSTGLQGCLHFVQKPRTSRGARQQWETLPDGVLLPFTVRLEKE